MKEKIQNFKSLVYWLLLLASIIFFVASKEMIPSPYGGILIAIAIILFIGYPVVRDYIFDQEKQRPAAKNKRIAKSIQAEKELNEFFEKEEKEFKEKIQYKEKSLIIIHKISGAMFQLIREKSQFYFVKVGGELTGMNPEKLITDFSEDTRYLKNKKDYFVMKNDITSLIFREYQRTAPWPDSSLLIMTIGGKVKKFIIPEHIDKEELEKFFDGCVSIQVISKKKNWYNEEEEDQDETVLPEADISTVLPEAAISAALPETAIPVTVPNKEIHFPKKETEIIKLVSFLLMILSIIVPVVFLLIHVFYKVVSVLCLLIPLITVLFFIRHHKKVNFVVESNGYFNGKKIEMILPLLLPSIGILFRSLLDFNILEQNRLWLLSAGILVILLTGFLLWAGKIYFGKTMNENYTKTQRKALKSMIITISLVMLFYIPAAVVQINYDFDYQAPVSRHTEVLEKRVEEDSRNGNDYYLTVVLSDQKKHDLKVSEDFYNKAKIGEIVVTEENSGFFGIPYAAILRSGLRS